MKSRHLIKILALLLLVVISISGCTGQQETEKEYVCPDGSVVDNASLCLAEQENETEEAETESDVEQEPSNEISEEEFETFAEKFGRKRMVDDIEEMYHMLTPTRRDMIPKEKFIDLYPEIYATGHYRSIVLSKTVIEDDEAFAYYDLTYKNGYKETSPQYYFKKEKGTLGFDGFTYLVYAGCYNTSDCYEGAREPILNDICKDVCEEETEFPLKSDEEYKCNFNTCQCNCYDSDRNISYYRKIDTNYFH